jgi:hypothetical protein
VEDAIALVMKVMSKTMDSTTLGSEKRKGTLPLGLRISNNFHSGICDANIRSGDQEATGQDLSTG